MAGEDKDRHQMMQNLFGDQSEEEEEEEEEEVQVESEHESNPQPGYPSDEGAEPEGEGEAEVHGPGEAEVVSEGEFHDPDVGSEADQDQSSQEVEVAEHREESDGKESETDEKEGYGERVATSRRRDVIESESERSEDHHYADNEDEEVGQTRSLSRSPEEEKDEPLISNSAPEIRDVFGDSDDEEQVEYTVHDNAEADFNRTNLEEEEDYDRELRPEDMVADEEARYDSDEGNVEAKVKERPVGPPLLLEIPLRHPPALSDKMNLIKVSNIMGIDSKPFDPKEYVDEDFFVTDESGSKKRIRLDNNIVRWRVVKRPDGTISRESNARFVRWSDGSLQLLIGNEVLDISVQDAQHDHAHLVRRHGKGILQSQGRVLSKMKFMPSSLSSTSHRLLTALVDARHKRVYKVKNCVTDIDPEREKEQKEKVLSQTIKANELLSRRKEKVHRKYTQTVRRERQLSPGFLEEALEEEEDTEYYDSRRSGGRRRFDEDMEMEARAEKRRLANTKKGQRDTPRKSFFNPAKSSQRQVEFSESEREESEYETEEEEEEIPSKRRRVVEAEDDLDEEDIVADEESEEEPEETKQKGRGPGSSSKRRGFESDEDSPPRKSAPQRRRNIVVDSDDE